MHVAQLAPPTYNQVTKHNLPQLQPKIFELLKQAEFIALDAEFTGLGPKRKATTATDIQERYHNLCELAKSHALIAFGLSIFIKSVPSGSSLTSTKDTEGAAKVDEDLERSYLVHNFNFSMLSENDYTVSPNSMIFLAENGLDLNQWILEGIPYTGGDRLVNEGGRELEAYACIRLCYFLSFYASLPPKLSTFVADLSDMFPGGLFDTKYISDYITRERASFLAFLFRKYERYNIRAKDGIEPTAKQVYSTFDVQPRLVLPAVQGNREAVVPATKSGNSLVPYCEGYAFHGVCKMSMRCGLSHDLDLILDAEEQQQVKKRGKRKRRHGSTDSQGADGGENRASLEIESSSNATEAGNTNQSKDVAPKTNGQGLLDMPPIATVAPPAENVLQPGEKFHSAYFDAFMTGAVFSHQMDQHRPDDIEAQARNKLYLIGKSIPLMIEKSAFAKFSPEHERLRTL
ncbi:Target of EGR1, member 1 (Nuclear) [Modicella reniformis]|uniref:Target of EGR1, member 1 (Nuclear) n=1 Tax=Modicella reniformis TaxID=1440133 RepID=A0A9P6SU51_9FUNG|nr:Target of EGR1, member 1 (Nuclear) [Modicella reniformis]